MLVRTFVLSSRFVVVCSLLVCLLACNKKPTLFENVSSSHSGISFNNKIVESDSINAIDVVNIYNGGGIGIGDFNNDGLQDIFFTGNMVPCKLYTNKGNMEFEDITDKAGVSGEGRWARGVAVIDINNDGLSDIYICNTIYKDSLQRRNILYVNQGIDKKGVPHFKDMAAAYGLDIHVQSTMAYFFDYDNDGDLDMYLVVNEASTGYDQSVFRQRNTTAGQKPSMGRLYRNDWSAAVNHPVYTDVSETAGMSFTGFGHAATICDINNDGWKDIYVSDDFISNNILYVNNHDGTFTNRAKEYFKHTSLNSMGQDVIDINNDGLPDVIELDMAPQDNLRKKMILGSGNYNTYQNFENFGYQYQYVRNTLQINQGNSLLENDSVGLPVFSDIGFMSGIAETDWSWTPLVTDFDNDGYRDIIVTNGFPKDVSDRDFMTYRQQATTLVPKEQLLKQIPEVKLHNYAYRNKGDLSFQDVTDAWGLPTPTFSNGAAYADLDNDGDMDMVINNINDKALLYKNTSREKSDTSNAFLTIKFVGDNKNNSGLGAVATIFYDHGKQQVYDNTPYRGYLSTMQPIAHFGLGKVSQVDSVIIEWSASKKQKLTNVPVNKRLAVNIKDAVTDIANRNSFSTDPLFREITTKAGINYKHLDYDVIDFNMQSILPHKLSEYCPALAVADMDGNGLDDLVIGGNNISPGQLFLQQKDGSFTQKSIAGFTSDSYKDEGILLFDANGDNKTDIYCVSGGFKDASGSPAYKDRLYINDGKGNFSADTTALPINTASKLCIRAFDYNKDGRLDLFVSGRVNPGKYPQPVSSFIYRNDSQNGHARFTDVTNAIAPGLKNIGLVCDALFTDFDNDNETDLLLVGEWMPLTFFKYMNGKFENVTGTTGIQNQTGWFNSIVAGDFRHTGRTDYIVGNLGLNSFYRASEEYPVYITAKDFENNGSYLAIPSLFLPDSAGNKKEFPANGRDNVIERMPSLKKRMLTYRSFGRSTLEEVLTPEKMKGAVRLQANTMQSCFVRNDGNGKFALIPLPEQAQVSALNGMIADDFDDDGNLDVLISGNDYSADVAVGRYDALNGLLLKGNGNGDFTPLSIMQSGIYIPGNGKALVKLLDSNGDYLVAASQHKDLLKLFSLKSQPKTIKLLPDDSYALIKYRNNKIEKKECYYGTSFLSQSSRFIIPGKDASGVTITNSKGIARTISLP